MKKILIFVVLVVIVGILGVRWWPSYSPFIIKEAHARAATSPEVERLSAQKQEFIVRIKQLRPGGSLAGRMIDLEGRKNQLLRHYPNGHPDIKILDEQIATMRTALEKLPQLEAEYTALNQKLELARTQAQAPAKKSIDFHSFLKPQYLRLPRLRFESEATLVYGGDPKNLEEEVGQLRADPSIPLAEATLEKVPGEPPQILVRGTASMPGKLMERLSRVVQAVIASSLAREKDALHKKVVTFQKQQQNLETNLKQLALERKALLMGPVPTTPNAQLIAQIESLKARRNLLIENYPTHTDIAQLGQQIKELLGKTGRRSTRLTEKLSIYDRQINETKVWMGYLGRRAEALAKEEKQAKSLWTLARPFQKPTWPRRVEGWPVLAGGVLAVALLGVVMRRAKKSKKIVSEPLPLDGLWKVPSAQPTASSVPEPPPSAVALEVVTPELPADPLTQKAASLYERWVEVAKLLYSPALQAPEGVLESVSPLLQESSEFLPEGHDVLARYLARSVEPGNLPAHVARTVLMALTGAEEAGASPEHRYAMALAALFHDLAVVPRPAAQQEEVGSEVGRLSAVLLRRIPGLAPALLAMVEEILIGMDEYKLETWHNIAQGRTLEPLSKVLREIDRFEKVMQKQKARLQRQLRPAANF